MPRSGAEARERLRDAALELYRDRGYDQTTTAQIAERAGVTERTFFRHFADKREVLFDGEAALRADFERGVASAPDDADPLRAVHIALLAAIPLIEGNRAHSVPRNEVIAATPALRERALAKQAALIGTLTAALQQRDVPSSQAVLAAHIGMAAFTEATLSWFADPTPGLDVLLQRAFDNVRALSESPAHRRTASGTTRLQSAGTSR